jgi:hypothetical protein
MNILKQLIGLLLITLAWIDPFSLGVNYQVLFFIIGFDLMHIIPKVIIFLADLFLDISGLGWLLIILLGVEFLIYVFKLKTLVGLFVKPLVVFGIIYLNGLGWELGVIVAGIDLLLNYSKKYI